VLCAVGDFGNGTFNLRQKPISSTNVQLTTSAPIAQNTCYRLAGFSAETSLKARKELFLIFLGWILCIFPL